MSRINAAVQNTWGTEAKDIDALIEQHATAGGATGLTAAFPVAGPVIAVAAMTPIVWSMYYRINQMYDIKVSKTVVRCLSSAIVSNLASNAFSYFAAAGLSLIPFAGTVISMIAVGAANYATVHVAGKTYATVIKKLVRNGDGSTTSEEEIQEAVNAALAQKDLKQELKEAKAHYADMKKKGIITGEESVDVISD